jgi:hypothetical protein
MIWRRRCLVLAPVLFFLAATLIMSCGGGSSSSSTTQTNYLSLIGLNVCEGEPPSPTPKPSSSATSTPTPICTPIVTSAAVGTVPGSNTVQFNAQGLFGYKTTTKTPKYRDVTDHSSTLWNPIAPTVTFPGMISYVGNGLFVGVTTGCTYFTVSASGFSQTVVVGVNTDPASCPTPPGSPAIPATSPAPTGP